MYFFPWDKFVYSSIIKIHTSGCSELLESIPFILLAGEVFSLQKFEIVWDTWRSGNWLDRDQMNIMGDTKFGILICSIFGALFVGHMVENCHGELGPFCLPASATDIAIFSIDQTSQISYFCHWVQKAVMGQTTVTMTSFGASLIWEVFQSIVSVQPPSWSSSDDHTQSTSHHM